MDKDYRSKSNVLVFHKTCAYKMEDVLCGYENWVLVTKELAEKKLSVSRS